MKSLVPLRHVWASEVNVHYRSILEATHDVATIYPDISVRSDDDLAPHVGDITVYTSGFPCASFSKAGTQKDALIPSTACSRSMSS